MRTLNTLTTLVDRLKLLEILHENAEQHSKIVAEARGSYIQKARAALRGKLEDLERGKFTSLVA